MGPWIQKSSTKTLPSSGCRLIPWSSFLKGSRHRRWRGSMTSPPSPCSTFLLEIRVQCSRYCIAKEARTVCFASVKCVLICVGLVQGPWSQASQEHHRREIRYEIRNSKRQFEVADYQVIDVMNDHLCYVI